MDLRQLRYFVTVAEEGHITRAASRLGMQQPPLSQQIRSLEEELGMQLFERHPKGVSLTQAGEALLEDSRRLLNEANAMSERMRAIASGRVGVLVIGFTSSAAAHSFTPQVLRECRRKYPGIALQVVEDNASGLTESVAAGKVACAFLRVPVTTPEGIVFDTLLREPVLAAVPRGHASLRGGRSTAMSLAELCKSPLILVRQTGAPGLYANLLALCARAGLEPAIGYEVPRMTTALNLAAAGAGVAVVPASMKGIHANAIEYRRLKGARTLDAPLTLAYRKADHSGPVKSFVQLVQAAAKQARG